MVVAVAVVRVVEVTLDQVIGVIAVRYTRVAAGRAVDVAGWMAGAAVAGRALRRVGRVDSDRVLVDVIAVDAVQVSIVEIVDVIGVLDSEVAAVGAVNVVVAWVDRVGHASSCWAGCAMAAGEMVRRDPRGNLRSDRIRREGSGAVRRSHACLVRTEVVAAGRRLIR